MKYANVIKDDLAVERKLYPGKYLSKNIKTLLL